MHFSSLWQVWELDGKKLPDLGNFKTSHRKKEQNFSVDARILIALLRKQPQSRDELITSGKISTSGFYRNMPLLIERGILKKDKTGGFSLFDFVAKPDYWTEIKNKFADVGAYEVEITIQKASDDGVDPITGWYKFKHDTKYSAKVIIVLINAPKLIAIAKGLGIKFRDDFEKKVFAGVILTQDSIHYMDQFTWQNELYKIWNTEDVMDGYDFSYRIGYLDWLRK